MTRFGYTLMTEQSGPKELVRYAVSAERAGFDFEVSSDHYFPWLSAQGHAPYAWSVLGAVAHATERVELFTYVTCPTMRYHPAVVAQKAATLQILADGRFTLGLGSGENLNEHVVGKRWPTVARRHEMLREAIQIIRELFTGELVDWRGEYFEVDSARIWDVPETPVPIAAAVSGDRSVGIFAPLADHLIAVQPDKALVDAWHYARRATG
ncbi:MAG TPA: TIGR03557 family F420-dependent LLM class oxidoreductase, partial [Mycobacterium sp.]